MKANKGNMESIYLQDPDDQLLKNTFRSLPQIGEISLSVEISSLEVMINRTENAGFCALVIEQFNIDEVRCKILAYKGKQGPCYDTGRVAVYSGIALAALDDDNHLLISGEEMPVCEKTATVYSLPPYQGLIRCTDADPVKVEKLKTNPEVFDCDNFEENQELLYSAIQNGIEAGERAYLYYPGPFSLLILEDGSIIRRGRINNVPKSAEKKLIRSEKLFRLSTDVIKDSEFFQKKYKSLGPLCLIESNNDLADLTKSDIPPDFSLLSGLKTDLKDRMIVTIKHDKEYFILTGSEPNDKLGCCPSDEVEEANQLVRAGILSSYRHPAPQGSCPVTTYSFREEMVKNDDKTAFKINQSFRNKVSKYLEKGKDNLLKRVAVWVLTGFVVLSVVLAITRMYKNEISHENLTLFEQLMPENEDQVVIILFHFEKRCTQCMNMEKMTRDLIAQEYLMDNNSKSITLKLLSIEDRKNRNMVDRFGVFTSTLVIISFEKKEEKQVSVLNDAFKYYLKEGTFKELVREELDKHIFIDDE